MRLFLGPLRSSRKILIWDSLTPPKGQKVALKPQREGILTWYSCGPTVYDSAHIGHASSYIRLDIIRRILEKQNLTVIQVMGTTDIDDKIIKRSNELGISWESLAHKYDQEFGQELELLNIRPPHIRARVTQFIPQIIKFVEKLLESKLAYVASDGSVYFDTSAYGNYGIFSNQEDADEDTKDSVKRNRKDFALWKGWKLNEPFWETPWGKGRPGWHIECSAIAGHFFGPRLDIHSGGNDLIFPHHENEEAQCCAHFGIKKWVTHWIHTGHLILQDAKMSKSLGNTVTIADFLKEHSSDTLRMFCLMHNARSHLFYSTDALNQAGKNLRRFHTFLNDCDAILNGVKPVNCDPESEEFLWTQLKVVQDQIDCLLCDNFDTPQAVVALDDFVIEFNSRFKYQKESSGHPIDYTLVLASKNLIADFFNTMGFTTKQQVGATSSDASLVETLLHELIDFRQTVRSYSLAADETDKAKRKALIKERQSLVNACDNVRNRLAAIDIEVKDHGQTSSWLRSASVNK